MEVAAVAPQVSTVTSGPLRQSMVQFSSGFSTFASAMSTFELDINGRRVRVDSEPGRPLLDVLREDLDLTGTKYGCGEGACRACTVLIDGRALTSCRLPVEQTVGKQIVTIEGLATHGDNGALALHVVQQAFLDSEAMQCGYCVPGMILTATDLLGRNPKPSRVEISQALEGNLCRCCGYPRILEAVEVASARLQGSAEEVKRG